MWCCCADACVLRMMAVCRSISLRDTRCKRAMLVSHVYLLSTVLWKVWGPGSMELGSRWRKPCGGPPNDLCSRRFFPVETSSSISLPPALGLPLSASAKLYRDVDDRVLYYLIQGTNQTDTQIRRYTLQSTLSPNKETYKDK